MPEDKSTIKKKTGSSETLKEFTNRIQGVLTDNLNKNVLKEEEEEEKNPLPKD